MKEEIRYFVADSYQCPIHDFGYPSNERVCSCSFYWSDGNFNREDNEIFSSIDSKNIQDKKYQEYCNA